MLNYIICTTYKLGMEITFTTLWFLHYRYSIMQFLLPFIVLVYTYTKICIAIWTSSKMSGVVDLKKNKTNFSQRNRDPLISKAMMNTVRQTIIVITLYIVTSLPFIGSMLWGTWDPKAPTLQFFTGINTL